MGVQPKIQSLTAALRTAYQEGRGEVFLIRDRVRDAIGVTKRDIATLHHVRDDATRLVRHEKDLADEVFADAVERARMTSRFVGQGIAAPIRGIARTIRRIRPAA